MTSEKDTTTLNEIEHHLQECDDDLVDTIAPVTQDVKHNVVLTGSIEVKIPG